MLEVSFNILPAVASSAVTAVLPQAPDIPTAIQIPNSNTFLSAAQVDVLQRLRTSWGYKVSLLTRPTPRHGDIPVVLLGEAHTKNRRTAALGEEVVVLFPHLGIESSNYDDIRDIGRLPFPSSLFGPLIGCRHPSTMDAVQIHSLPAHFKEHIRQELRKWIGEIKGPAERRVESQVEVMLKAGCYTRKIILSPDAVTRFLTGEDVIGDSLPLCMEHGSAALERMDPQIKLALIETLVLYAFSGLLLVLGNPLQAIGLTSGNIACVGIISTILTFALVLLSNSKRERYMAHVISSAVQNSTDTGAWLMIMGRGHIGGITERLTNCYGFSPAEVP